MRRLVARFGPLGFALWLVWSAVDFVALLPVYRALFTAWGVHL